MSRSGYTDDCDGWGLIMWRGQVASAIRGKRGQAFLREMRDALDALPEKKLCYHDLQRPDGACCAIGAVGRARGIDMTDMDPEDATESGRLSEMFDIANQLVKEIEFENDECDRHWYAALKYATDGRPVYGKDENGRRCYVYETNDAGERVNENGLTKEESIARQDESRWHRMRRWVDEQIRSESTEGTK